MIEKVKIIFFGSSDFSIFCLDELKKKNILPVQIITTPDKPVGRGLKLEANPVKLWAQVNNINFLTPKKFDLDFISKMQNISDMLFLVASYGKIIPKNIIEMPKYRTLNIHPSLLPKYRGPSPLQEQILNSELTVGVTIMKIDEQVDHGPLVAQEKIVLENILNFRELENRLAKTGADLFINVLPDWVSGKIETKDQDHAQATFTKKIEKPDGELDIINGDPYKNYLKFLAFETWPGTFFFVEKDGRKNRIIIKEAEFKNNYFIIKKVLPEGKKEMPYDDFLRGLR